MDSFPSCSTDLLSMIRREFGSDQARYAQKPSKSRLMSMRTHISFSNVSLEVSTDYFSSKKTSSSSLEADYGQYTPPTKPLVRPFAITVIFVPRFFHLRSYFEIVIDDSTTAQWTPIQRSHTSCPPPTLCSTPIADPTTAQQTAQLSQQPLSGWRTWWWSAPC